RNVVSSYGWALGYLGGGLLLAMNLALFSQTASLGLSAGHAVRINLASAGAWWAVFTLVPLFGLRNRQPAARLRPGTHYLVVAFFGALVFNWVAAALGTKRAILASLVIWTGAVTYAYGWLRTADQFFVLGAVIAIVLGGSQALSRALYSLMIPRGQEAEYFS